MLLPLYEIVHILADVVAKVAVGMPTMGVELTDDMAKVADGIATESMF